MFKIMRKNNFLEKDNYHFKFNKYENLNFSFWKYIFQQWSFPMYSRNWYKQI